MRKNQLDALEPNAIAAVTTSVRGDGSYTVDNPELAVHLSCAISLKRIADTLAGNTDGSTSGIHHCLMDLTSHITRQS